MQIIVETFRNSGEPSSRKVRVRPVVGQFKQSYRVWCSTDKRTALPVGALFRVNVTRVDQPHGDSYLRINLDEQWERINRTQAEKFIRKQQVGDN